VQDEIVYQRLALEWGEMLLDAALRRWLQLESHETLAYEDKVVAQLHVLNEVSASLWHLHKHMVRANRLLKELRQELKRSQNPLTLKRPYGSSAPSCISVYPG